MESTGNGLSREERLRGKNDVSRLIGQGRRGSCSCLHYCWLCPNGAETDRIVVSVPKKLFKRAVRRNLLKRRIREAYRLQKELLAGNVVGQTPARDAGGQMPAGSATFGFDVLLQYNSPEVADFAAIKADVAAVLRRIAE